MNRGFSLVACLVAGTAALYASYDALTRLAVAVGWSVTAAPGLPLTIDVIALAAGVRYVRLHPDQREARALAYKGVTWSAAASVVGNAVVHAGLTHGWSLSHRALAVVVSAVPAVGLAYVVHLVAAPVEQAPAPAPAPRRRHAAPVPQQRAELPEPTPEPEPEPEPQQQPEPEPRPLVPVGNPRPGSQRARGLALLAERAERGETLPTSKELADELGCTQRNAQNILAEWNANAA